VYTPAISPDMEYQEASRELKQSCTTVQIWNSDWDTHVHKSKVHKQESKNVIAYASGSHLGLLALNGQTQRLNERECLSCTIPLSEKELAQEQALSLPW